VWSGLRWENRLSVVWSGRMGRIYRNCAVWEGGGERWGGMEGRVIERDFVWFRRVVGGGVGGMGGRGGVCKTAIPLPPKP
jgi:hypothetical protein